MWPSLFHWRRQSYDLLPALSVRGDRLRRSMRLVAMAWMVGVIWLACISGGQLKIFARMLGFDDFAFGVLGAIPFLANLGQLLASELIERTGVRKGMFLETGAAHRLAWLAVAAVPLLLPIPSRLAVVVTLSLLMFSWLMASFSTPAWFTWMAALVPRRIRGRYFGQRDRLALMVQVPTVIAVGLILDHVSNDSLPQTAEAQPVLLWTIAGIFAVAAICGAIDVLTFIWVPEVVPPPAASPPHQHGEPSAGKRKVSRMWSAPGRLAGALREMLIDPLSDRVFRRYVLYGATIAFSGTVAGWYYWLNAMENLGFNTLAANMVFLVFGPLVAMVTSPLWGKAIDYWGRRPVLIIATAGSCISIIFWLLMTTKHGSAGPIALAVAPWLARFGWHGDPASLPAGAFVAAAFAGMFGSATWSGINLATFGIVLGLSEGAGRSRHVAASAVLTSIGGVLGGIVGGIVTQSLSWMQEHPWTAGPFVWNNWHVSFAIALVARLGSIGWVIGMPDPGAARVRDVMRLMGSNFYTAATARLSYPLRAFGWARFGDKRPPKRRKRRRGG